MKTPRFLSEELDRRSFLSHLAKACLGTTLLASGLPAQTRSGAKAKKVIYLFMNGGMSHLDTFDPKPGREVQGSTEVVKTKVAGVRLAGSLPTLAERFGEVALIRSLNSREAAHDRAAYQLHTSYPPLSSVLHPSLGSWIVKQGGALHAELPPYVAVGGSSFSSGFFENTLDPFRVGDPDRALLNVSPAKNVDDARLDARLAFLRKSEEAFLDRFGKVEAVRDVGAFYDKAVTLMRSKDLEAFELTKEDDATRAAYGKNPFGQGVLLARRLVEKDVRFVEVTLGGWDTHADNFARVPALARQLDTALCALIEDLKSRGLFEETLVVVASEFGRTPAINDAAGRDHHSRVFSALLAGGGIRGGQVIGSSDADGLDPRDDPQTMMNLNASIAWALGVDPVAETISPVGRPFNLSGGGTVIKKLFTG